MGNIYLENTSLHGLKYIAGKGVSWVERIFWMTICAIFLYFCYTFMASSWKLYVNNPTSFGMNTAYLDWSTNFPAVTVCEAESLEKISAFGEAMFGEDRNRNMDTFISEMIFYNGHCYTCATYCGKLFHCPENYLEWIGQYRASCRNLIMNCTWIGQPFDCCEHFAPLLTERGICYTINSIKANSTKKIELLSNKSTGAGYLKFNLQESARVIVHSPEDTTYLNEDTTLSISTRWGEVLNMMVKVVETVNDPDLKRLPIKDRECQFPDENILSRHTYYSYSACIVECRAKAQMDLCGCVHHNMPGQSPGSKTTCNITGLLCLTENADFLRDYPTADNYNRSFACDCLPSCTEMELNLLLETSEELDLDSDASNDEYATRVTIFMASLPTTKFSRNVVRDELDLTVNLGGIASLFFGAGLLSIIEIIYYFCIRPVPNLNQRFQNRNEDVVVWNKFDISNRKSSLFTITQLPKHFTAANDLIPKMERVSYVKNTVNYFNH